MRKEGRVKDDCGRGYTTRKIIQEYEFIMSKPEVTIQMLIDHMERINNKISYQTAKRDMMFFADALQMYVEINDQYNGRIRSSRHIFKHIRQRRIIVIYEQEARSRSRNETEKNSSEAATSRYEKDSAAG